MFKCLITFVVAVAESGFVVESTPFCTVIVVYALSVELSAIPITCLPSVVADAFVVFPPDAKITADGVMPNPDID